MGSSGRKDCGRRGLGQARIAQLDDAHEQLARRIQTFYGAYLERSVGSSLSAALIRTPSAESEHSGYERDTGYL